MTTGTHLSLVALSRTDVVENINVNVVQHDAMAVGVRSSIVKDVAENDARLG